MKAAAYLRVSTEEQATDGYGLSAQEQSIRSYCSAMGWELVELYTDAGKSGKSMRGRDALALLMQDAERRHFDRLVFWKLDRLGRNLRDLLHICEQLEQLGVGLVSIQESIDTGTPVGRMMRNVLGSFAQFEREVIVERIKTGLAEKRRQGLLLGTLPAGYVRRPDGGVDPDPVAAPLVQEAFRRYATGMYSLSKLADWADSAGFRTREGNPHTKMSMRDLLTTVSYTGRVAYDRREGGAIVAEGRHPALVTEELFSEVKSVLERRRYTKPVAPWGRQAYPLSGIGRCSSCSMPLVGLTATRKAVRYMRCATTHKHGRTACSQPMVKAGLFEAQIASYVGGMRLRPDELEEVAGELRLRQGRSPSQEPGKIQRAVERLKNQYLWGDVSETEYRSRLQELQDLLRVAESPPDVLDLERSMSYLLDMGRLWSQTSGQRQREFVQEVFLEIQVEGAQVTTIRPKPAYAPLFVSDRKERFGGRCSLVGATGFEPATS